ncbi:MAG: hypothetical protein DRO11_02365 [Methanobacteriota archaeon]|nr:MAG: hypothetical protein DRO11_02365 [Euryarchaeota archaeon]
MTNKKNGENNNITLDPIKYLTNHAWKRLLEIRELKGMLHDEPWVFSKNTDILARYGKVDEDNSLYLEIRDSLRELQNVEQPLRTQINNLINGIISVYFSDMTQVFELLKASSTKKGEE